MFDLSRALTKKTVRLQRLEAEKKQLQEEIDLLTAAMPILGDQACKSAILGAAPEGSDPGAEPSASSRDIRTHFP